MEAEQILTILKLTQSLATIEHALVVKSYADDRGLTPFAEFSPIFSEKKERVNGQWVVTGIKGLTFKDHYSVQNRWSQKSGGYSVPYRKTERDVKRETGYTDNDGKPKTETGVEVTVGVITNRDYAALAAMAMARIPGWNYEEERKAFMHLATGFCANSHKPPSGWTIEDVARKRAEEMALKKAFGKEPSQSRELYAGAITMDHPDAVAALYGSDPVRREALPAPVIEAELVTAPEPPAFDEAADAAMVAGLAMETDAEPTGDVPADLPRDNWTNFFHYAQEHLGYDTVPHVVNVLRPVFGGDNPKWNPWNNVKINGDPATFWKVLVEHKHAG